MSKLFASIDIGSNSSLLLIAKEVVAEDGSKSLEAVIQKQETCRLGDRLHQDNVISVDRINELSRILVSYRQSISNVGATLKACVLTEAVRLADNQQEILDLVEKIVWQKPLVLSGHEEGLLGWKAVSGSYATPDKKIVTLDVGGGSSEISDGNAIVSLPVGALKMMQKFGSIPDFSLEEELEDLLLNQGFFEAVPVDEFKNKILYLIGGTATALAMMIQNLNEYSYEKVENFQFEFSELDQIITKLSEIDDAERSQIAGLEGGRDEINISG